MTDVISILFWIWLGGAVIWTIILHLPFGGERHGSKGWMWLNIAIWPLPTAMLIYAVLFADLRKGGDARNIREKEHEQNESSKAE